ncbi:minor capsid protein [Capybara microvirus Cap1_SP_263]|nr:minor capsid protein [Capybara microvirus Cap1_SP_263]
MGVAEIIMLIVGIVATVAGAAVTASSTNNTNKTNLSLNESNNQSNKELQELAYQQNLDQWNAENEYNLPINQMQRFKDAGLNPNLVYGQSSVSASSPKLQYQNQNAGSLIPYQSNLFKDLAESKWLEFAAKHSELELKKQAGEDAHNISLKQQDLLDQQINTQRQIGTGYLLDNEKKEAEKPFWSSNAQNQNILNGYNLTLRENDVNRITETNTLQDLAIKKTEQELFFANELHKFDKDKYTISNKLLQQTYEHNAKKISDTLLQLQLENKHKALTIDQVQNALKEYGLNVKARTAERLVNEYRQQFYLIYGQYPEEMDLEHAPYLWARHEAIESFGKKAFAPLLNNSYPRRFYNGLWLYSNY